MKHNAKCATVMRGINEALSINGMKAELMTMTHDYYDNLAFPQYARDSRSNPLILGDQYVILTAANGYPYYINVTADSPLTIAAEVFRFAQYK